MASKIELRATPSKTNHFVSMSSLMTTNEYFSKMQIDVFRGWGGEIQQVFCAKPGKIISILESLKTLFKYLKIRLYGKG